MIVNWKGNGVIVTPIKPNKKIKGSGKGSVCMIPGINNVHPGDWRLIEQHLTDKIKSGKLIVIAEKETKQVKGKEVVEYTEKKIEDMDIKELNKILSECNDLKSLIKWEEETADQEKRFAITKRKEFVIEKTKATPEQIEKMAG